MISDKIRDILNEQINKEFYSAYLYLSMSAYFSEIGLYGFSHWTKIQSKEEIEHGMILFEYVLGRKSQVHLGQISTPKFELSSPLEVFEQIYNLFRHELERPLLLLYHNLPKHSQQSIQEQFHYLQDL